MATENAFLDKFGVTVLWNSLKNYINKVMPKKISAFSNDEGYIKGISTLTFTGAQEATFNGKHNVTINIPNSSGEVTPGTTNYNDLTNKPSINGILLSGNKTLSNLGINIPTRVSQLSNDADYLTSSSLTGYVKRTDLTNVAFTGSYNSLTDKPTIPVVPSNISAFYNDAGYLTTHLDISGKVDYSELNNRLSNIYTKALVDALIDEIQTEGGGEVDLRNYYTKDAADGRFQPIGNYLTSHLDISGKANTADLKAVAFSGNYSDLIGKPTIPVDSNLVHKTGNENITGNKTFDDLIILYDPSNYIEHFGGYLNIHSDLGVLISGNGLETFGCGIYSDEQIECPTIKSTNLNEQDSNKFFATDGTIQTIDLTTKQDALVSGQNIKTINGTSILGSGNITIQGGSGGSASKLYVYDSTDGITYNGNPVTSFDDFLTESIYNAVFQNYSGGLVYRLSRVKYYDGYEAALNKINQLVFTGYLFNSDGILKRDFYISRTYENDPYDYSVVSIDTSIATFDTASQTLDIETTSSSTIPVPAEETWERWVDNGTICVGYDKYAKQKKQVSNDGGVTWSDTSETRTGSLIETNSTDCGYNPEVDYANQYFTIKSLEDNNVISFKDYNGSNSATHKTVSISVDGGNTWTNYTSSAEGTTLGTLNTGNKMLVKGSEYLYSGNAFNSTKQFNVEGNIMSLSHGDNYSNVTSMGAANQFDSLFFGSEYLVSAENLILPPSVLPYCYCMMFRNCTSLTTAPVLPVTDLSVTEIADSCYAQMFDGCTSLNYIKMMATNISASADCLSYWVRGVASTGTFVKNSAATWNVTGVDGIPTGWTVQTASA